MRAADTGQTSIPGDTRLRRAAPRPLATLTAAVLLLLPGIAGTAAPSRPSGNATPAAATATATTPTTTSTTATATTQAGGSAVLGAPSTVGIASTATGYLEVTDTGAVSGHHATVYGSMSGHHLPAPVVGVAVDPQTGGYWLATSAGNVYNFHAPWYGSMNGVALPAPVVGITATSTGYLLTTDAGNVYNFHTPWYGSRAKAGVPAPVVAIAVDTFSNGYWLVTSAGNVYNFHAPWYDSAIGRSQAPVDGMVATPTGYLVTTSAGNVLPFDTAFHGSAVAEVSSSPAVAVAADPAVSGAYWVAAEDGTVYGFGTPSLGSTTTASAPYCSSAQLRVTEGSGYGAVDHSALPLRFTNLSGQLCRINGYPGVAGLSPAGVQVLQAKRALRGFMGGVAPDQHQLPVVPLAPGETASALVSGLNGAVGSPSCPKLSALLVTPPNTSVPTRLAAAPDDPGDCGGIRVHPVIFGLTGTAT